MHLSPCIPTYSAVRAEMEMLRESRARDKADGVDRDACIVDRNQFFNTQVTRERFRSEFTQEGLLCLGNLGISAMTTAVPGSVSHVRTSHATRFLCTAAKRASDLSGVPQRHGTLKKLLGFKRLAKKKDAFRFFVVLRRFEWILD